MKKPLQDINPALYQKKGKVHLNKCFPSLQLALSGTTSLCKDLAKDWGRSVVVNIYYLDRGWVRKFERLFSLSDVYRHKPTQVSCD